MKLEIAKTQISLICKIGHNGKCKYQRNCAVSLKERGQHGIREKIKLWFLTREQILPKVTKALFVNRENGVNSIMVNLSITIKSNQFVKNKYRTSDFLKKQRNKVSKFLHDTLQ